MRRRNGSAGFTLIELMITVAIVGILASVATPLYIKYSYKARTVEASTNLGAIRTSQVSYKSSQDTYINTTIEPDIDGVPSGLKKPWPRFSGPDDAHLTGVGTFSNIGFEPSGQVYFHYGCTFQGEAVRCEAATDLDHDQRAALYSLNWRLNPTDLEPPGPISGAVPVPEWGPVINMTIGRY